MATTKTSTPTPPVPDYWQNAGFGSKQQYVAGQQTRYNDAVATGNTDLAKRLEADSIKANYALVIPQNKPQSETKTEPVYTPPMNEPTNSPNQGPGFTPPAPTNNVPIYTPAMPVRDEAAIRKYANEQVQKQLDQLGLYSQQQIRAGETTANQQLQGLQTGYDRQRGLITEDRNVQNVENARRLSPFSGRSDYALGMIEQQRGRMDNEMLQDHQTRQANVQQDLANLRNTINEKLALMQNAAPQEAEALYQSILNDERQYDLAINGQQIEGLMANSQLNNTAFNQALATYGANRQAFENNRAFDYGQYADMVNWTGYVPNGGSLASMSGLGNAGLNAFSADGGGMRTLQGQAADLQNRQFNVDTALQFGDRAGMILTPQTDVSGYIRQIQGGNAPQTWQAQQQQIQNNQWQQNFDRAKYESDRDYQFRTQQAAIAEGQWQQQYALDVEKFGFQQANEMWSQAFQESRANQDDAYRKATLDQQMTQADRTAATQAANSIMNSGLVSVATDPITGAQSITVPNKDSLNNYIKALNLSDNATDALLYQFGLDSYVKK